MEKNFDQWNKEKKKIDKSEKLPFFHEWKNLNTDLLSIKKEIKKLFD